jgi:hypothetical protein
MRRINDLWLIALVLALGGAAAAGRGPAAPTGTPSPAPTQGNAVGGRVSFLGHEPAGGTDTYRWKLTPTADMVLLFGLQDWRSAGNAVPRGASVRLQAGAAIELALQVRQDEGMLRVECGAVGTEERPSLALPVPAGWTLRQSHADRELYVGQRYYQTLWDGDVVEVTHNGTKHVRTLRFLACGAPADAEEREFSPSAEWYEVLPVPVDSRFVLYGTVTGTDGRPMPDVMVHVATGWGTLLGGGRTVTGPDGRYRLPFGAGWLMQRSEDAPMGVGVQAAAAGVRPPGFYEVNMCRQGDLLMAEDRMLMEEDTYRDHREAGRFVLPDQPYELNFTIAPAARLSGRLVDPDGNPVAPQRIWVMTEVLPRASSVYDQTETGPNGSFGFDSLPVGSPVQIGLRHMAPGGPRHGVDIWTDPHTFDAPGPYDCRVTYDHALGTLRLEMRP